MATIGLCFVAWLLSSVLWAMIFGGAAKLGECEDDGR